MGRIGGDEFGVILSHTEEEAAKVKATSLPDMIKKWKSGVSVKPSPVKQMLKRVVLLLHC